jgi:LCP family protein required for cell wall assembly
VLPPRRWPRRILVGVNALTVICLVGVGTVYGYARYRLDQIRTIHNLPFAGGSSGGNTSAPMNILLVGDNSRVGLDPAEAAKFGTTDEAGGAHSDVTMILHLEPKTGRVSLLSIPRDLFVPLPPTNISGKVGKIDSALNGSNFQFSDGAAQLITTIQNDLGIPIDHYVEINFDGFQQTIDAVGGINMYFPTYLYDSGSALRTPRTGCLHLDGSEALAVVRSRHLQYFAPGDNLSDPESWAQEPESDLARIGRNHTFLQVLAATLTSQGVATNIGKLNSVLGAVINQVTIDPGLKGDLIPLVKAFRHVNLASVPQMTLPISVVPQTQYRYAGGAYGTVDFPVEPLDHQVIAQWQGVANPTVAPSSVAVQVRNATNAARQASDTTAALAGLGFAASNMGQGTVLATAAETMVRYHPGPDGLAQAETLLQSLTGAVMMQSDPTVPAGTVALDVGTSLSTGTPSTGSAAATSTAGSGRAAATSTIPTPGGQPISSATDHVTAWDPVACTPGQPVVAG